MSTTRAQQLRGNQTDAEGLLWSRLRDRQLDDFKFRRQSPIGRYVVDFICMEPRLIVEVDGGQHAVQTRRDGARSAWMAGQGLQVIRFWNNDVLGNIEGVLTVIWIALGEGT